MSKQLMTFPAEVRESIETIYINNGALMAEHCEQICEQLSISTESLMIQLLPLAASFSHSPISDFKAGAVVRGEEHDGKVSLYLGANLEFLGQPLCYSLHAEQAAISNAWCYGETSVTAIATSAAPCGHCRQFLYEVSDSNSLSVLLPSNNSELSTKHLLNGFVNVDLSQLLPNAFGPLDLGSKKRLMEPNSTRLRLIDSKDDALLTKALEAASLSYAPYTNNYTGCALELTNGEIFTGRYAENVAFNPSLLPFSAALSKMLVNNNDPQQIKRVILVEAQSKISNRRVTENQLSAVSKKLKLEYHPASSDADFVDEL